MFFLFMMIEDIPDRLQGRDMLCEALIAGMAKGDMKALEELYLATQTAVYGFALSILKRPQAAEDVMQDTYVKLFAAAGDYRPQGKPMAWVLTIARNLALMQLRKQRETGEFPGDDRLEAGDGDFTRGSVDRMVLHAALTTLSDEERQVVVLHSLSGLKHREIADLLDLPLSTVLSKYRRALSKLQKYLVKEEA